MLHSAERQTRIGGDHAVDEDAAGFDFFDKSIAFALIVGPGRRAQTEGRNIGEIDCFVNVFHAK